MNGLTDYQMHKLTLAVEKNGLQNIVAGLAEVARQKAAMACAFEENYPPNNRDANSWQEDSEVLIKIASRLKK